MSLDPDSCAVCGLGASAGPVHLLSTTRPIGYAHEGECTGLLWELSYLEATDCTAHEREECLYRWRRHRARVRCEPFTEAWPLSPAERDLELQLLLRGWS